MRSIIHKNRNPNKNKHDSDLEAALILSINDFSFSLYKEFRAITETGNIFFSPLSIHGIMFEACGGASSKTFDEILTAINLNNTTYSQKTYSVLLNKLTSENDHLKVITGMFVDSVFNVKKSFAEKSTKCLKSTVEKLNFKNDQETVRQYINNWVLEKTDNKINDLFPRGSITKVNNFVLANAALFSSAWKYKFRDTVDEFFYVTPSKKLSVKMMVLRRFLQYYHDDDFKFAVLSLPYEHDANKMIIILPDEKDGLKSVEDNFSKINLHEILNKMTGYHVTVKLPRFKLEESFQIEETLSNLGCPTMFTMEANFSNVVDHGHLYVSNIVHKARVDVNEKGTEDASGTGIRSVQYCPRPLRPKVHFVADHPFIVFIISGTEAVLFMGRLSQP